MKKNILKIALHNTFCILIFATVSGCGKSDLPDFNKLEKMRILAFQSSSPEVNPGSTVTITPIISDVNATSLTYSAQTCLDAGISTGADPTCEGNPTKQILATDVALTLPGLSESWTGAADGFSVTVPADTIIFASRSTQDQYNGIAFIVEYTLKNNLGSVLKSIKRVIVSPTSKTQKNSNPSITQVFADGSVMSSLTLNAIVNLTTDLSLSAAESYVVQNTDGTQSTYTENLAVTWFITDGKTKYFRSENLNSNEYTTPTSSPVGRSAYLIAVARDDRGGLSFVKKKF